MPNPITISPPVLSDLAVYSINVRLSERLPWLTTAFGVCQRISTENGLIPKVPSDSNNTEEYISLLPNSDFGQFSFWDIKDNAEIQINGDSINLNFSAGLVLWGCLKNVFPGEDWKENTVSNVEILVIKALQGGRFGDATIEMNNIYRDGKNIYPGYYTKEVERQFLMRPYFGIRVEMDVFFSQNNC